MIDFVQCYPLFDDGDDVDCLQVRIKFKILKKTSLIYIHSQQKTKMIVSFINKDPKCSSILIFN